MTNCMITILRPLVVGLAVLGMQTGCSGISRGITEAVLDSSKSGADTRACYVRGRPIEGIQAALDKQARADRGGQSGHRTLKVLMVHGIGSHQPGYATRMAENLARDLNLPRVQENYKEFHLSFPRISDRDLGVIRFSRYLNPDDSREMVFAELTWDPIVEQEKQEIAFDNSGEYSFRRTPLNNTLKKFVNDTLPDVLMFNGTSQQLIKTAIAQSLCWLMIPSWDALPDGGAQFCNSSDPRHRPGFDDEFVFITHSLGSRITVDALQWIAEKAAEAAKHDPSLQDIVRPLFLCDSPPFS